ncbi:MAG: MATE family multidrug resistance protein [Paracoccaceae bacterium]|jgi:MATE family multidrug resistance protein
MSNIELASLTHKRVLKIALPIVLANATIPLLGAVDTGVVGQLGLAAPIGAVGIGAIILSAIYWIFGFLRMGTTGLTSQAHGAGDAVEVDALLMRALLTGIAAGFVVFLVQFPLLWGAFALAPASDEVERLARDYTAIRVYSAPAAIAVYGISGWLIALERTKAVLILQFWMNGLNVVLDLWFVLGLGWGVSGVAFATVLSEVSGLALGLWLCRAGFSGGAWRNWPKIFDITKLKHMLVINTDILLRSVLLQGAFMSFLFLGAGLGDVKLAANQVLLQFMEITAFALDGFAFAAEALVGQAMGAKARASLRRAALLTSLWGVVIVLALATFFALTGGYLIDLMSKNIDVQAEARVYLGWIVLAPVIGIASWMLDGIFIGATRTRDMRNAMFLATLIYVASVWVLLPAFGNHGLWGAMMIFFVARAVTLGVRYPALEASAD